MEYGGLYLTNLDDNIFSHKMLYGAGAESLFFWNCNGRSNYRPSWNALKRMGHRDEIEAWTKAGEADLSAPLVRLRTLGGWHISAIAPG